MQWTDEQKAVFQWFESPSSKSLVVRARAGSGKTTTIVEAVRRAPEEKVLLSAYNAEISRELHDRAGSFAEVRTMHSLGNRFVKINKRSLKLDNFERADRLTKQVLGIDDNKPHEVPDTVIHAISRINRHIREHSPFIADEAELREVIEKFSLFPAEEDHVLRSISAASFRCIEIARKEYPAPYYDYADMIFLPLTFNWVQRWFELVVIDEAQDMTRAQLEMAMRSCKRNGRMVLVGDDRQAIYGFRGADSGSLDRLKKLLEADERRLSVSFRCATSIVEEAQKMVPDIEATETAIEGDIFHDDLATLYRKVRAGNFILSRTRAPLAPICIRLISSGRPARIIGRNVGKDVRMLVESFKAKTVRQVKQSAYNWAEERVRRLRDKIRDEETLAVRIEDTLDQRDLVLNLCNRAEEDGDDVLELYTLIDEIFDKDASPSDFICLSTVHGAKGLESDTVYLLDWSFRYKKYEDDDVIGHGRYREGGEEDNIRYVAITRAKSLLCYVENGQPVWEDHP